MPSPGLPVDFTYDPPIALTGYSLVELWLPIEPPEITAVTSPVIKVVLSELLALLPPIKYSTLPPVIVTLVSPIVTL